MPTKEDRASTTSIRALHITVHFEQWKINKNVPSDELSQEATILVLPTVVPGMPLGGVAGVSGHPEIVLGGTRHRKYMR
jgi:hypothetical protein